MSEWLPINEIADQVKTGKQTAVDNVKRALETIEEHREYNAIISVITDRSMQRALEIDKKVSSGEAVGRLAGVPFIAKDNFLTFGSETTAASNILRGFEAPYQSTVIERLEAEGAICVAKANMDAFAHGGSTENSDIFTTKNPRDETRVPGGSSGGPAASIVLDMAPFALGTDTGGSNRQPASFSGCVGYKPTYGLVSRNGVVAMASSTDTIGPLTKTVKDTEIVLDVISGKDEFDSTTIERDPESYVSDATEFSFAGKKIGVIKEYMTEGVEPGVLAQITFAIDKIKAAGAEVVEVSLPSLPLALASYYIICPAEVSSNLSRYDGQRYGYSHADATTLDESYAWSRREGFGNEAKRRIMIGTYVLSSGYYDAYYKKAQTVRTKLIHEFNAVFENVDFLLGPTTPTVAFAIGANDQDPLAMYLSDAMTVSASLVGIPAISIPAGESEGLPVGLQLMAKQRADKELLVLADATEELIV